MPDINGLMGVGLGKGGLWGAVILGIIFSAISLYLGWIILVGVGLTVAIPIAMTLIAVLLLFYGIKVAISAIICFFAALMM